MSKLFHFHKWVLVAIDNVVTVTPFRSSIWIYECTICHNHKQKRFDGNFQMPRKEDKELQELKRMIRNE